ncbi:MAG: hypothetical protein GEV09_17205 [Pseudonocardiaceae bacterium]|nr:hypothetical protein [Pseudonocardiaceae bacterium]
MLLGSLVRPVLPAPTGELVVGALALFVLAGEARLHPWTLPHRRAQVPRGVVGEGAEGGALRFGFEMGTGVRTRMPSNLPYLPLVAVALLAGWLAALITGVGFGLGRAGMALGRHHSPDPDWWDAQWRRHGHGIRVLLALLAVALTVPIVLG